MPEHRRVSLSPTSLSFDDQPTGTTSGAKQVTVTNSGTGPLILSSIQTTSQFAATNTCGAPVASRRQLHDSGHLHSFGFRDPNRDSDNCRQRPRQPTKCALTGNARAGPPGIGLGVASGGSASATVTAGAAATYALSIGGSGMSGTASLTCTGAPTGAACSVPATIPLNASSASTFNASATTTSRSPAGFYHRGSDPSLGGGNFRESKFFSRQPRPNNFVYRACVSTSPGTGSRNLFVRRQRSHLAGADAQSERYPKGTYTLVITAKSGPNTQTQNLTLTVK